MNKLLILLFISFSFFSGYSANLLVTNTNDSGNGSLRQQIMNSSTGDTIVFDPSIDGSSIVLNSGINVNVSNLFVLGNGEGNTIISGGGNSNIFTVSAGLNFKIQACEITDGHAISSAYAGFLYVPSGNGNIVIEACNIHDCTALGARNVLMHNGSGQVRIINSYIHQNGIGVNSESIFTRNLEVESSTFALNNGSSLVSIDGAFNEIKSSTFVNNSNSYIIYSAASNGVIENNTIVNITSGFGLYLSSSSGISYPALYNNIVYNHQNDDVYFDDINLLDPTITESNNIVGTCSANGLVSCPAFYSSSDPMIGPLADNGGLTLTCAIGCSSLAYNSGTNLSSVTSDQRGEPIYGTIDIGSYEIQADSSLMTVSTCATSYSSPSGSYTWTTSGIYQDTLQNIFGCDSIVTVDLTLNPQINTSSTVMDATCFGGLGNVDLQILSGTAPYSFQWNNGATSEDLINVPAGNYLFQVVDAMGCSGNGSVTVNEADEIVIQLSGTDANCGNDDGAIQTNVVSGGVAPFSIIWNNGENTANIDSLSSGLYYMQLTDSDGCTASASININDLGGAVLSVNSITSPTCNGDSDAAIDVNVTGGAQPYSFDWSNGTTTEDLNGVSSGNYSLTVVDDLGCETSLDLIINSTPDISINSTVMDASCSGSDGDISVAVSGGSGSYNYQWGPNAGNATTPSVSNLSPGIYFLSVSDANGCLSSELITVNSVGGPQINNNLIVQPSCVGSSLGSIDVNVSGGTMPYSYSWNSGQNTEDISGLSPGTYELTVTDQNACVVVNGVVMNSLIPAAETICMVTVDTATSTNLLVWEKGDTSSVSHYNIYREGNATGVYNLVGSQAVNQISEWVDPNADPSLRAWRYKISVVDSCGNESAPSPVHKTIHVTSNLGLGNVINLSWDFYSGFSYGSYFITRYHSTTGWMNLDTIPSTLNTWTDNSAPGIDSTLKYVVYIEPASACTSTRANNHNTSRSNKTQPVAGGGGADFINEDLLVLGASIYPNPSSGMVHINFNTVPEGEWNFELHDMSGKLLESVAKNGNSTIDLSSYEDGMYFIHIVKGKYSASYKILLRKN